MIYALGSACSYVDRWRNADWYVSIFAALAGVAALIQAIGGRLTADREALFVYFLAIDALMLSAYYVLPLMVFDVHIPPGVYAGSALVLAGFVLIKVSQ